MTDQHVLYRFYSATGELLYIGITNDAWRRFSQHRADKAWWPEVANICQQSFATSDELKAAESRAIRSEKPRYNKVHNGHSAPVISEPGARHPLVGKFFHTTRSCPHGSNVAVWQGRVVEVLSGDVLIIELYEWLLGEPNGQQLISLADFMAKSPVLYQTPEDMRFSYDHGYLYHSQKCEETATQNPPTATQFLKELRP